MVVVPYVKGLSEAFARIMKSHGIATANRPHRTLRNFVVHPKDKVRDEEKTELIYRVIIISGFGIYGAAVVPDSGVGNTWQRLTLILHEFLS